MFLLTSPVPFDRVLLCRLMTVSGQSVALLPNLHILLLSSNLLTSLHPRALAGLGVLSSLALNQNRLKDLPAGLLANTSSLQGGEHVGWSYNMNSEQ